MFTDKQTQKFKMNYKDLLSKTLLILSSPTKASEQFSENPEGKNVLQNFVYPMSGLWARSEFRGSFIGKDMIPDVFQVALTNCCAMAVALFGGFFLAVYLLNKILRGWFSSYVPNDRLREFVAYSMTVKFVLDIFSSLFSLQLILLILQVYTLFIVFEGARRFLSLKEDKVTLFTLVATIVILMCPALIDIIFNKLSVALN